MKPFDDTIPEEIAHDTLTAQLQHIHRKPVPMTQTEQEQSVTRVRNRLFHVDTHASPESVVVQPIAAVTAPMTPPHRSAKIIRFINTFAAVLVVGALISASLLLFTHRLPSSPTTIQSPPLSVNSSGSSVTISSQRGGLEASMQLTVGPYFLSELLAVDLSLTNHTQTTFELAGIPTTTPCDPALSILMIRGNAPHFQLTIDRGAISCPGGMTQFKPEQAIHIREYIPLIDSGNVTFTQSARFLITKPEAGGGQVTTNGPDPLAGHWPAIAIKVNPHIPQDHKLSFTRSGLHILVTAPKPAQSHLLYLYTVQCQDFQDGGSSFSGNFAWQPLPTNPIVRPGCPGKNIQWTFAFGAPGYAITQGSYS